MSGIAGQSVVAEARKLIGRPYRYGAAGPSAFDCSGLVQYVLTQLGVHGVPRTSEEQWAWCQHIKRSQLQPGDLIFEQWPGDNSPPGHVLIYAGAGKVIEAPETGQDVHLRPWSPSETTIIGYGRPPGVNGGAAGGSSSGSGSGSILSLPSAVTKMFDQATEIAHAAMWLFQPGNWARIVAGLFGFILLAFGLGFLVAAGM